MILAEMRHLFWDGPKRKCDTYYGTERVLPFQQEAKMISQANFDLRITILIFSSRSLDGDAEVARVMSGFGDIVQMQDYRMYKMNAYGSVAYKKLVKLGVSGCITEDIMGESGSSEPISTLSILSSRNRGVLKAMNRSNVKVNGFNQLLHHINGLLSQSAELGNETAHYLLSN